MWVCTQIINIIVYIVDSGKFLRECLSSWWEDDRDSADKERVPKGPEKHLIIFYKLILLPENKSKSQYWYQMLPSLLGGIPGNLNFKWLFLWLCSFFITFSLCVMYSVCIFMCGHILVWVSKSHRVYTQAPWVWVPTFHLAWDRASCSCASRDPSVYTSCLALEVLWLQTCACALHAS